MFDPNKMNRAMRRALKFGTMGHTSEHERMGRAPNGGGLNNGLRAASAKSYKTETDLKTATANGWQVRKVVLTISKMSTRTDRTSCLYSPKVVRNTHAQEAYLWAKTPKK